MTNSHKKGKNSILKRDREKKIIIITCTFWTNENICQIWADKLWISLLLVLLTVTLKLCVFLFKIY